MSKNTTVKVSVTLSVDADAWMSNFGAMTRDELRADVKVYFAEHCRAQLELIGCEAKPEPIQLTGWTRMA
jgi:hypothetical protein